MSQIPNIESAAVPAAQRAGLLDANDPMKFSDAALTDPPSYVRNFAHAVAGHQASLDQVVQATEQAAAAQPFASSIDVYSAVKALLDRVEASGFEVDVFQDRGENSCIRVVNKGEKRVTITLAGTGIVNKPN